MDNPEMKTNPNYMPITCPYCGSREIAFVTEYHKCIGARIFFILLTAATIFIAYMNFQDSLRGITPSEGLIALMFILAVFAIFLLIGVFVAESKTHVQAICKNCGTLWLLN